MSGSPTTSIKRKLILIQGTTAVLAVAICCTLFIINDISIFKSSSARKMISVAQIVGDNSIAALQFMDQESVNSTLQNLNKEPDIREAVVFDAKGKAFARYTQTGVTPTVDHSTLMSLDITQLTDSRLTGRQLLVSYKIYQEKTFIGSVVISAELKDLSEVIVAYLKVTFFVIAASLLAAFILSTFLQRSISTRLLSLVTKTREISATGNYSLRVPFEGSDEIGILATEFNTMLEQIERIERFLKESNIHLKNYAQVLERSNKELEEFAYISSHDMKSPITSLEGLLDLMEKKEAVRPEQRSLFDMARRSARQMKKTINALNEIIAFRKTLNIQRQTILFSQAVQEIREAIGSLIFSSGAVITTDFSACPAVHYPAVHLRSILQNLITNSIKYKQAGKPPVIHIKTWQEDNSVVLEVSDQGLGIDMERYKDKLYGLFQRFHTSQEGMGIGLHMIHSIIESYKGRILIESEVNKGTTFRIYLEDATV